ncbi:DUF4405 domain-containing protein [Rhizobium leguminosarum bv. viciae]|nr:DUF4405 domain-containing protein [Rhizobium leguminosarum bv. viciae]NKK87493.1 DUF4405 domain-containing protein [Rhizobium leguminosarum bv. viciae]
MMLTLVLSLAYWWLDNLAHELFGTALFVLLIWHLVVNRRWFINLRHGSYDVIRVATVGLHFALILNMILLLLTSVVISKSVFASLPLPDSIYLRDVHWFAAYWVMVIAGIHVGLHWSRVLLLTRISSPSRLRTLLLRGLAACVAAFGLWSWNILGVSGKLTFTYSLDFWDFTSSVAPFFGHWIGVVGLAAVVTYYMLQVWRSRRRHAVLQR